MHNDNENAGIIINEAILPIKGTNPHTNAIAKTIKNITNKIPIFPFICSFAALFNSALVILNSSFYFSNNILCHILSHVNNVL